MENSQALLHETRPKYNEATRVSQSEWLRHRSSSRSQYLIMAHDSVGRSPAQETKSGKVWVFGYESLEFGMGWDGIGNLHLGTSNDGPDVNWEWELRSCSVGRWLC